MSLTAWHVAGVLNQAADSLSRNHLSLFLTLNPQALQGPTVVPDDLKELVLNHTLQWTAPSWTKLLASTLAAVWPHQPEPPIEPRLTSYSVHKVEPNRFYVE